MPSATVHRLPAPPTVHWGYFDPRLEPVLTVSSGDLVAIETLTHHAGDAPDLLMDASIADVFGRVTDRGPGPHLLTGPIAVDGARPGDVLQVDILEATPRLPYGSNLAAHWGFLYGEIPVERVTVYELDAQARLGRALFGYDWTATPLADQPGRSSNPTRTHDSAHCRASSSPFVRISAPWAWRRKPHSGCRRCRPVTTVAMSTTGVSGQAGPCTTRCRCPAPCCPSVTRTSRRATAKSAALRSRHR
jgi:hypothetical protein